MRAAVALAAMLAWTPAPARAQATEPSPAERAEALNQEGRQKVRVLDLDGAADSFRAAIELVPDPRYYFNLCYVLEKQGELREARVACQVVVDADTDAALEGKASGTLAAIDEALAAGEPAQERPPVRESELEASPDPGQAPPPLSVPPAPAPPVRVAVVAGLLSTTFAADEASFLRRLGGSVGAELDARLAGPASVVAGLGVSRRGGKVPTDDLDTLFGDVDVNLSYIDAPVLLRLSFGSTVAVFADLGAALSVLVDHGVEGDQLMGRDVDLSTFDAAAVAGLGLRFDTGAARLGLALRYLHGLVDINDNEQDSLHNRGFGAFATVSF